MSDWSGFDPFAFFLYEFDEAVNGISFLGWMILLDLFLCKDPFARTGSQRIQSRHPPFRPGPLTMHPITAMVTPLR